MFHTTIAVRRAIYAAVEPAFDDEDELPSNCESIYRSVLINSSLVTWLFLY